MNRSKKDRTPVLFTDELRSWPVSKSKGQCGSKIDAISSIPRKKASKKIIGPGSHVSVLYSWLWSFLSELFIGGGNYVNIQLGMFSIFSREVGKSLNNEKATSVVCWRSSRWCRFIGESDRRKLRCEKNLTSNYNLCDRTTTINKLLLLRKIPSA